MDYSAEFGAHGGSRTRGFYRIVRVPAAGDARLQPAVPFNVVLAATYRLKTGCSATELHGREPRSLDRIGGHRKLPGRSCLTNAGRDPFVSHDAK